MAVSRSQKESILSTLEAHLQEGKSVAFTTSQRITVEEVTKMKRELRGEGVVFMLAKKTLIRLAFKNVHSVDLDLDTLPGQVALTISKNDPMAGLSIVNRYVKEWKKDEKIAFVASYMEGRMLGAEETTKLASLPSREVLLAKLLGSMKAPIAGLARFFEGARTELEAKGLTKVADLIQAAPAVKEEKAEEVTPAPETEEEKTEVTSRTPDVPAPEAPTSEVTEVSETETETTSESSETK